MMDKRLLILTLACVVSPHALPVRAQTPSAVQAEPADAATSVEITPLAAAAIANAEALIGEPYRWGGRMTAGNPDIDCLGLLFLAYGPPTDTPWRRYPVDPSKIVNSKMLGEPVSGLDGTLKPDVDTSLLRPGDVMYLLIEGYEIPDDPLLITETAKYWPWHTALYVGGAEPTVIHADPGGVVKKQSLESMHFDALFVTRLAQP